MIKVKIPIGRGENGQVEFFVIERDHVPLMPVSFYLGGELDGVHINRIIWNGLSIPEKPSRELKRVEDHNVFEGYIPIDGDELIVIPAFDFFAPAIIYGIAVAGTIYGVSGAVLNIVVMMAISMIVSTLVSYLTAPAKPKGQGMTNSGTSYGWQGYDNSYGPGDPVPVIFGRHKATVKVIHYEVEEEYIHGANQKIDLTKTKSYVKMLGSLGRGKISAVNNVCLNANPVENFGSDLEVTTKLGTQGQLAIPGFDENKTSYQVGVEIPLIGTWIKSHHWYLNQYCIPTVENGYTYEATTLTTGITAGTEPAWPTSVGQTIVDGGVTWTCRADNRYQYTTSAIQDIIGFQVHFEAPSGLYASGPGGQVPNKIWIKVEHKTYGGSTWIDDGEDVVSACKTGALRWSKRVDGLTEDRYTIRVTKRKAAFWMEGTSAGNYSAVHALQIGKVSEIRKQDIVPTYDGYGLIAIRGLATSQMSDAPPTMTAVVDGVELPVWNGAAWVTEWTDNPVFIARAIALNPDWGFGAWITGDYDADDAESDLDDITLKIAAAYCQTYGGSKKHTCNYVWNQRRKFIPMMQDILGPARINMFQSCGKFRFIPETTKTPSQMFNRANIIKGSFKRNWVDETLNYNAYDVSFLSDQQDYTPYPFRIDLGLSPVKPKSLSLTGVTVGDEAVQDAEYQLNVARDLHETIAFQVGTDAIASLPGDVFSFSHTVPKIGLANGRAGADSVSTSQITLDEAVTLVGGKTYTIVVRFSGGANPDVIETKTVANGAGTYTTLTVTTPFSQLVKKYDLYAIGEVGNTVKDYKMVEIEEKEDDIAEIRALEYKASVYVTNKTLDEVAKKKIPESKIAPPPVLSVDATEEVQYTDNKVKVINLGVHWHPSEPVEGYGIYGGANLYYTNGVITEVIGEFDNAEAWSGGAANTVFGQFKKGQSWKVSGAGFFSSRRDFTAKDLSTSDKVWVGVLFHIDNIANMGASNSVIFYLGSGGGYYSKTILKANLGNGWNCALFRIDGMTPSGSPDLSAITYAIVAGTGGGTVLNVSFENFYIYDDFAWIFKSEVDGNSYRWPNVSMGDVYLFKVNPYSTSKVEQAAPTYGAVYITGYDTTPPEEPVGFALDLKATGLTITANWTPYVDDDLDGYEVHAKKTAADFTPDATTKVKSTGRDNTCAFTVASAGTWAVKIRAFDKARNWDETTQSYLPNYGPYCTFQVVTVATVSGKNTNPPTLPGNQGATCNWVRTGQKTTATVKFAWDASSDPDGDEVFYDVKYWIKTDETETDAKTATAKKGDLYINVAQCEISVVYQFKVFARDNWGNVCSWVGNIPEITTVDTTPPEAGIIATITGLGQKNQIKVSWTVDSAKLTAMKDFKEWIIYRGTTNVFASSVEYAIETNKSLRFKVDKDVTEGTGYYYWAKVRDMAGNLSASPVGPTAQTFPTAIVTKDTTAPTGGPGTSTIVLTRMSDNKKWYKEIQVSFLGAQDTESGMDQYNVQLYGNASGSYVKTGPSHKEEADPANNNDERAVTKTCIITGNFAVRNAAGSVVSYKGQVQAQDKQRNKTAWIDGTPSSNASTAVSTPAWAVVNPVKSNALTITAKIQKVTDKDLGGYEWYIETSTIADPPTGLTPVQTGSSIQFTFTAPAAGTYYIRVRAYDTEDNNGVPNYSSLSTQQSIAVTVSLVDDVTPPTDPYGLSAGTPVITNAAIGKMKCLISWSASTDTSGKTVKYSVRIWKSGDSSTNAEKHLIQATQEQLYNLDSGTTYSWDVTAVDWVGNVSNTVAGSNISVTDDTTAPAAPTIRQIKQVGGNTHLLWIKNTESDCKEYVVYANTSGSTPTKQVSSGIFQRVGHPHTSTNINIGRKAEDNSTTITANATWYFWLSCMDRAANESALTYFGSVVTKKGYAKNSSTGAIEDEDGTQASADNILDGATNRLVTTNEKTGAGRGFSALNSSNKLVTGLDPSITPAVIIPSQFTNLYCYKTAAQQVQITCDSISLRNASGLYQAIKNINSACHTDWAGPAAYGRDQAGAFTPGSWVHFFVIATDAGAYATLCSASYSAPTLPGGYTYWARVGATNYSASIIRAWTQKNRDAWETNFAFADVGPAVAGTYEVVPGLSRCLPVTALCARGFAGKSSAYAALSNIAVASDSSGSHAQNGDIPAATPSGIIGLGTVFDVPLVTAQTLYWTANKTNAVFAVWITGWQDNI